MTKPVYIETVSGNIIDLTASTYDTLSVEDIFAGLARIQRFNGRSRVFDNGVSVLQHSYAMYRYLRDSLGVDDYLCVYALMHDAHEALVGDIPSPLSTQMGEFGLFLDDVQDKIKRRFAIGVVHSDTVKRVDHLACAVEWSEFIVRNDEARLCNGEYYGWTPELVETPEYGQYLSNLLSARELSTDNLVYHCCNILYKHLATKYLRQEH